MRSVKLPAHVALLLVSSLLIESRRGQQVGPKGQENVQKGGLCYEWPFDQDGSLSLNEEVTTSGYEETQQPEPLEGDDTFRALLAVSIYELRPLQDLRRQLKMSIELCLHWTDPRLAMNAECKEAMNFTESCPKEWMKIYKMEDINGVIWRPPLMIMNMDSIQENFVLNDDTMVSVNGCNGKVVIISFVQVTIHCPMDFTWYPFDYHDCPMIFHSPSMFKTAKNLTLDWMKYPVLERRHYASLQGEMEPTNWDRRVAVMRKTEECVDCTRQVRLDFRFIRLKTSFCIQTVLPSFLLVIASYSSLFVPHQMVPGRMTLAITTTLTLMAMITSVFDKSPKTSYLKAIDVWLIVCFLFTFIVLIEFCVVIFLFREPSEEERRCFTPECKAKLHKRHRLAGKVESWSRFSMPLGFGLFSLIFIVILLIPPKFTAAKGWEKHDIAYLDFEF